MLARGGGEASCWQGDLYWRFDLKEMLIGITGRREGMLYISRRHPLFVRNRSASTKESGS